jgi:hypothetical protein
MQNSSKEIYVMSDAIAFNAMPQNPKRYSDYSQGTNIQQHQPAASSNIVKDTEFITRVNESVNAMTDSLGRGFTQEPSTIRNQLSRASSRISDALSVLTSTVDIVQGVEQDNKNGDPYFTEATRAAGRGMGAALLGGAATVAATSIGLAAGPILATGVAIGLIGGAAAGAAVGDQLAQAVVWARKNWF